MRKLVELCIVLCITAMGCAASQPTHKQVNSLTPMKGVSLSPRRFQSDDFTTFFEKAAQAGDIVSWAGDWNELDTEKGGPKVVTELAHMYELIPVVEVQFFEQSTGQLLRPLNSKTTQQYLSSAVTFATMHEPPYLGFGIEVNALYEKSPHDFEAFVTFYNEVYTAVKAASPDTKVFTVFQLEKMKGLSGGLFGGTNDPDKAQWFLLDMFTSDITAFSTYPGLIYKNPSDIPADYYTEIMLHTHNPVAFTEIGWHTDPFPPGWESSEAEQAAFVETFFRLTKNLNMEIAIWSFLYDQKIGRPFESMGLYRADGNARLAWDVWITCGEPSHALQCVRF